MFCMILLWIAAMNDGVAQEELGKNWTLDRMEDSIEINPGDVVEVINHYGNIRARGTEENTVQLIGNVQRDPKDNAVLRMETKKENGRLLVEVVYRGDDKDTIKEGGKRRLDLTIFVPNAAMFKANVFKGTLEAKVDCDVDLHNERGKIFVRTDGHVKAKTNQGPIHAVIKKIDQKEPYVLESYLGDIKVEVPKTSSLTITAVSGGRIASDWSTEVSVDRTTRIRTAKVKVNQGEHTLNVDNKSGNIYLIEGHWDTKEK